MGRNALVAHHAVVAFAGATFGASGYTGAPTFLPFCLCPKEPHIVAGEFFALGVTGQADYKTGFLIHEPPLRVDAVRLLSGRKALCPRYLSVRVVF